MVKTGIYNKFVFHPPKDDVFETYSLIRNQIAEAMDQATVRRPSSRIELAKFIEENYRWIYPYVGKLVCYDLDNVTSDLDPKPSILKLELLPDYETRERMWKETKNIFLRTGWFPYVTGSDEVDKGFIIGDEMTAVLMHHVQDNVERLGGLGAYGDVRPTFLLDQDKFDPSKGGFIGNSCLLSLEKMDLLLDAGIPWDGVRKDSFREEIPKLILLTHPHADHTKAFPELMKDPSATFLVGYITLEFLLRELKDPKMDETFLDLDLFRRIVPITFDKPVIFPDGSSVTAVPTEHYPGSMAFILKFTDGRSLFYSGDLNFSSRYYMERTVMDAISSNAFDTSIIDGSFLGEKGQRLPVRTDQEQEVVVEEIGASMDDGYHNIIVTDAKTYGVHIFLALYGKLIDKRGQRAFRPVFVDNDILEQVKSIEHWLKRPSDRGKHLANDIVEKLSKRYMSRSVKVYGFSSLAGRSIAYLDKIGNNAAIMLDANRLVSDRGYVPIETFDLLNHKKVRVIVLTKKAIDKDLASRLRYVFKDAEIIDLAGEWAYLHTPPDVLKQVILENYMVFGNIYIFHTSHRNIREFQAKLGSEGFKDEVRLIYSKGQR